MTTAEPRLRRQDIEGLRGLAVLLVVFFHAGVSWFRGAFVAVDVFFVLSGFFLTTTLTRSLVTDDGFDLANVYARRIWRLLPAMLLVSVFTLASAMLLYAPIDRASVAENVSAVALFLSNITFASQGVNYFSAGENPVLHTWTLGVEWQLALIFPLLIALLAMVASKRAAAESAQVRRELVMKTVFTGILIIGAASFLASVLISSSAPMWSYFGPHTRLWAFAAGAAASFVAGGGQNIFGGSGQRATSIQLVGLAAIVVPALVYDRSLPYPGAIALVPVLGTLLLLCVGTAGNETPVGRAFAASPLASMGKVSYGWYLWHWPLMVLGGVLFPGIGVTGRLVFGFAGLALAVLTHVFVERPFYERVMPRFLAREPLWYAATACAALLILAQLSALASNRYVARTVHSMFAAAREDRMDHSCWVRSLSSMSTGECAFGDANAATTLALLGDSHAEHWLGGLDRAGKSRGWRIEAHVMGGCPVSDFSGLTSGASSRRYLECNRYREAMLTHLVAQKPSAVILSSFDSYMETGDGPLAEYLVHESAWTTGLRRTYSRLTRAGIRVIVIRGTPRIPFDVPTCLSRREAQLPLSRSCTYEPNRAFIARARRAQDIAATNLNVQFIDMNDQICATSRCETMRDGVVMFTDDNHLTASFTRSLAPLLGDRIEAALSPVQPLQMR